MKLAPFIVTTEQNELIDKVVSGLLPHKGYDEVGAASVMESLFRVVHIEEVYGLQYIFLQMLRNFSKIAIYRGEKFFGAITRDVYIASLEASLVDLIRRPAFKLDIFAQEYGKTFNLDIEESFNDALDFVGTEAATKYDELFEMGVTTEEASNYINVLKDSLKLEIVGYVVSNTARIIGSGLQGYRKFMIGYDDGIAYNKSAMAEVESRFNAVDGNMSDYLTVSDLSSYEKVVEFRKKNKSKYLPIFYTGIAPYDSSGVAISTQDIVNLVGDEGTGKTRMCCDWSYKAMMQGANLLYVCGETEKIKIDAMLTAIHVYNLYKINLKASDILDPGNIKGASSLEELEDIQEKINLATADLHSNKAYGKLYTLGFFYYEDCYDKLLAEIRRYNINVVVIDHVAAMLCNGTYTTNGHLDSRQKRIDFLMENEKIIVKDTNVAFINVSHTSADTYKTIHGGTDDTSTEGLGSRIGSMSSETGKAASLEFLLWVPNSFKDKGLLLIALMKQRDVAPVPSPFVLARCGNVCIHNYSDDLQAKILGDKDSSGIEFIDSALEEEEE